MRKGGAGKTHAERLASRDGYFAPESVIRRVANSLLIPLLGGGPAVLLQVAHPLVAAGVAAHSDYERDLWRRLVRTLEAFYFIVYGTREEAERAGLRVQTAHAHVRGQTPERHGPFPAGTRYSASDPELQLWVHATLVETALAIQNRFGSRLERREEEAFYREMALVARLLGLPRAVIPATLSDFRAYLDAMLASPVIVVTQPAREIAAVVLRAPLPAPLRVLRPAHRVATAGLLPDRLRNEYGLAWSAARAAALPLAARSLLATSNPLFVAARWVSPPARGGRVSGSRSRLPRGPRRRDRARARPS
ncbi:MAG: DUF2236 domain-containing protein [Actinomycetota bacterium]|nr:DUF2236 domain-containing protein [Actinomycetota bacterium]